MSDLPGDGGVVWKIQRLLRRTSCASNGDHLPENRGF
jgi:hypothetical protein